MDKFVSTAKVNRYQNEVYWLEEKVDNLEDRKIKLQRAYTIKEDELALAEDNLRKQFYIADTIRSLKRSRLSNDIGDAIEDRALSPEVRRVIDSYKNVIDALNSEICQVNYEISNIKNQIYSLRQKINCCS